ncbi:MAG TPA: hypothetical protein VG405_00340 [Solirubrobacteraceae bacterium]|nr:hypothetical protein [Solirubrobacteraceae bacterium]
MGRDVCKRDHFHAARNASQSHGFPNEIVVDVSRVLNNLGPGIADPDIAFEPGGDNHMDPLVDARR